MDSRSLDLFSSNAVRPGSMGCRAEITATMNDAMRRAAARGISREEIAARMSTYLGEKVSAGTLNGFVAPSHTTKAQESGQPIRDISLMRAMAFDAAIEEHALLSLFAEKLGRCRIVNEQDAALLEWARLHRQEKELAERKKALEAMFKLNGGAK